MKVVIVGQVYHNSVTKGTSFDIAKRRNPYESKEQP